MEKYEYRAEDLPPHFRMWMAWAQDLWDENRDAGIDMLMLYLAPILAASRRQREQEMETV